MYTVGSYLAARLSQIGPKHHFAVAGDFNLVLLDELLKNKDLEQVYCRNELNCGYAAGGYARACGSGAAVVTFSVGGLSAINAIGRAYTENLPVILVSGAPNTNDHATEHLLYHTLATHDFSYQLEVAKTITAAAITSPIEAPHQIDHAIRTAQEETGVYRNRMQYRRGFLRGAGADQQRRRRNQAIQSPWRPPSRQQQSFCSKRKPVLLIGSTFRAAGAEKQAIELAEALGCTVTVMAAAKSFFPEDHPQFAGI